MRTLLGLGIKIYQCEHIHILIVEQFEGFFNELKLINMFYYTKDQIREKKLLNHRYFIKKAVLQ